MFWVRFCRGVSRCLFVIFFVVDAEGAFVGDPALALGGDKFSDAVLFDKFQVFDLAHAVFCSVAFVELPEAGAWELRAIAAEFSGAFGADSKSAFYAGDRLGLLDVFASRAGIFFAQVSLADAAIHAAWGDQVLGDWAFHF